MAYDFLIEVNSRQLAWSTFFWKVLIENFVENMHNVIGLTHDRWVGLKNMTVFDIVIKCDWVGNFVYVLKMEDSKCLYIVMEHAIGRVNIKLFLFGI